MAGRGWDGIKTPLVRFWEGARSREQILKGVKDKNERDLLEYAFTPAPSPIRILLLCSCFHLPSRL